MTASAPFIVRPDPAVEEAGRRVPDPDADLRPSATAGPGVAPARVAFPPRVIRGCRVQIVGGVAFVEVDGQTVAFAVTDDTTHRDAAAEGLSLVRNGEDGRKRGLPVYASVGGAS